MKSTIPENKNIHAASTNTIWIEASKGKSPFSTEFPKLGDIFPWPWRTMTFLGLSIAIPPGASLKDFSRIFGDMEMRENDDYGIRGGMGRVIVNGNVFLSVPLKYLPYLPNVNAYSIKGIIKDEKDVPMQWSDPNERVNGYLGRDDVVKLEMTTADGKAFPGLRLILNLREPRGDPDRPDLNKERQP